MGGFPRTMKVLFIGFRDLLHPWYDDFLEGVGGKHSVVMYDPQSPLAPQFRGVGVVVDQGGWGTREMIEVAISSGVKLWQVIGTGLDKIDVRYILEKGLPLANTPGIYSGIALAEHAVFLMLGVAKKLHESSNNLNSGVFFVPMTDELHGKTLGLVGFGASARELAKRAWAMGMRLLAVDAVEVPPAVREEYHLDFLGSPASIDKLLRESDYLSLHTPLIPATRHMINSQSFALMKPTAVLVNVARGGLVDETALIAALQSGKIRGAGLDVFAQEPVDLKNPLLHMDNVVATPHQAGQSFGTSRRRGNAAAENVFRVEQNLPPLHLITSVD
jgi:phosphoglycerate dehydrogenase-like enzyme